MVNHLKRLIKALVYNKRRAIELNKIVKDFCKKSNGIIKIKMIQDVSKGIAEGVISYEDFCKLYDETLNRLKIEELN